MPDDDGEGENDGIETAPYTWGGPFPVRHETEAGVVERTITFDYETSELVTDGGTIQVHPDVADPEQTERDLTRTVASQLVDRQVTRWDTAMNTAHDVQVASDVFGDAIGYYHYQSGDDTYQEVPLSITNAAAAELAETMSAQPGQGLYAHINLSEFPGNGPDGRLLLAPDHVESTVLPPDVSVNQDADPTLTARIVDSAATGKQTTGWHQLGGNLLNRFGERQYLQDTETNPTLFAKRTDLRTSEEGPRPLGAGEIERAPQVAAVVSSPAMQAEAVKRGFKDGIHYIAPIVAIVNPHTMIETVFVPFQKGRPIQDISNTSYGEWVKGSELARADAVIQELRGQFEANGITPNDLNATQLLVTADAATGNLRLHLIDAEDFERRLPDPGTPNADSE
jgi:hypothetical protein